MGISLFTITLLISYAGDSEYLLIKIFIQKNLMDQYLLTLCSILSYIRIKFRIAVI